MGKFLIEDMAGIPVEVDYASEFRYRSPLVDQPHAAGRRHPVGRDGGHADGDGAGAADGRRVLAVVNVVGSQAGRIADDVIYMHTGLEIGVAASKTFTSQIICLYMLGLAPGPPARHAVVRARPRRWSPTWRTLPHLVGRTLAIDNAYIELANRYHTKNDFLYLGAASTTPSPWRARSSSRRSRTSTPRATRPAR